MAKRPANKPKTKGKQRVARKGMTSDRLRDSLMKGLRLRIEFRIGIITCSGSSAVRGLRGAIRLCSVIDAPFCTRAGRG
jgi:hypothetical protein